MSRPVTSVVLLAALGPLLLWLAPTAPPRAPIVAGAAAPIGVMAGVALFVCLSRGRPRVLLTRLALVTALVVAAAGTSEEAIWRAFALGRLAPVLGAWTAIAVTTAAFAVTHLPALRVRGAAAQLATGLVFGVLFTLTGSLFACALAHATYNVLAVLGRHVLPANAAFSLRRVEKRLGRRTILSSIDLCVERGTLVSLLGPNGAGKTTLVSLLLGLRRPTVGDVRVFGGDPRDWRARRRLGATPQEMGFPPTLRVSEVLDIAGGRGGIEAFGLQDVLRRQTGALSGGQRRRLALAIAFARSPDLVVLDEPTTGLDVEARRAAWGAIRSFAAGGGTVLLTTHHLEEARVLSDRVVVLAEGRIVADGSPAALEACAGADLETAFLRLVRA
ncbi:MAG: ATP-binding cassette domain-containing protein [Actinobacteria bacterium]|nr:ATP-binding cassette domain-containing protein [Actinomycetota bacterium]